MKLAPLLAAATLTILVSGCTADDSSTANPSAPAGSSGSSTVTPSTAPSDPASEPAASQSASPHPSSTESGVAEPAGPVIEVSIDGDDVSPSGERVDATVGEPVTFVVTSDRAGGLHVHSSPEQSPEFAAGTTTITVTIDKPGVVEVEEHESDRVIVQLEVR